MPRDYDDNIFESSRMTFGAHLEVLRLHLWKAVFGLLAALAVSLLFTPYAFRWIAAPIEEALRAYHREQVSALIERLDNDDPAMLQLNRPLEIKIAAAQDGQPVSVWLVEPLRTLHSLHPGLMHVNGQGTLKVFGPAEGMLAYLKIWLYCGIVLASPWIFYQGWQFVGEGLYPHEKHLVRRCLPFSLALFLAGVALCQFAVVPKALEALLFFNRWLRLDPDIRFGEWLTFAVMMPLVFGLTFQLPIVMLLLQRLGIASPSVWLGHWKIAFFVIQIVAAVLSPTMDALCMQFLAAPLFGLYLLGIGVCYWVGPPSEPALELEQSVA